MLKTSLNIVFNEVFSFLCFKGFDSMSKSLVIVFFVFLTIPLKAQMKESKYEGFKLGVKFGGNFDTSFGTNHFGSSSGHLVYGAVFQIPIYKPLYLQVEALKTKARAGYKLGNEKDNIGTSWTLDYISIPLQLKFKFLGVLNLQYGIQYDFLTRAELELNSVIGHGHTSIQGLSKYDLSEVRGVGIDLKGGAFVDFKHVIGLRNIVKVPIDIYQNEIDFIRKSYFVISFGYRH